MTRSLQLTCCFLALALAPAARGVLIEASVADDRLNPGQTTTLTLALAQEASGDQPISALSGEIEIDGLRRVVFVDQSTIGGGMPDVVLGETWDDGIFFLNFNDTLNFSVTSQSLGGDRVIGELTLIANGPGTAEFTLGRSMAFANFGGADALEEVPIGNIGETLASVTVPIPEPSTAALLLLGLLWFPFRRRTQKIAGVGIGALAGLALWGSAGVAQAGQVYTVELTASLSQSEVAVGEKTILTLEMKQFPDTDQAVSVLAGQYIMGDGFAGIDITGENGLPDPTLRGETWDHFNFYVSTSPTPGPILNFAVSSDEMLGGDRLIAEFEITGTAPTTVPFVIGNAEAWADPDGTGAVIPTGVGNIGATVATLTVSNSGAAIPEPSTALLFSLGLAAFAIQGARQPGRASPGSRSRS